MKFRYALLLGFMIVTTAVRAELAMEISTPKTHYVQHEPFWVVLTFRNTGTQDEKLVPSFSTAIDHMVYYTTTPDGKEYQYNSVMQAGLGAEPD